MRGGFRYINSAFMTPPHQQLHTPGSINRHINPAFSSRAFCHPPGPFTASRHGSPEGGLEPPHYPHMDANFRPRNEVATVRLMPRPSSAGASRLQDGPLLEFSARNKGKEHVLVLYVEQRDQGRIPSVLGELFFLMEYRDQAIYLPGRTHEFSLDKGLHIILIINQQVLRSLRCGVAHRTKTRDA